jgi:hypothetical protein
VKLKGEASSIATPAAKEKIVDPLWDGTFKAVLYMNITNEESIRRATGRRMDPVT